MTGCSRGIDVVRIVKVRYRYLYGVSVNVRRCNLGEDEKTLGVEAIVHQ